MFRSFRVSVEDPTWKVLPAAMRKCNLVGDPKNYAIYIVHGDLDRCFKIDERPLMVFKELEAHGKKPILMLGKLATILGRESDGTVPSTKPEIEETFVAAQALPPVLQKQAAEVDDDSDDSGDNAFESQGELMSGKYCWNSHLTRNISHRQRHLDPISDSGSCFKLKSGSSIEIFSAIR